MEAKPRVFVTRWIPDKGLEMVRAACDVRRWEEDSPTPRDLLGSV